MVHEQDDAINSCKKQLVDGPQAPLHSICCSAIVDEQGDTETEDVYWLKWLRQRNNL